MDQSTAWGIESRLEEISDKTMTKRERIATAAMAGILGAVGSDWRSMDSDDVKDMALVSIGHADALIEELNRGNE